MNSAARTATDPRVYQLVVLYGLLLYGMTALAFPISALHVVGVAASCVVAEIAFSRCLCRPLQDLHSPLITALSLCLLLRVDALPFAILAGAIAVSSKFMLRVHGRHIFNPAAFAIALLVLTTDHAWVSPGQWGHVAFVGLGMAGAGLLVLTRARRLDICIAFAVAWTLIAIGRSVYFGDPISIAVHQLSNGATVLFAFFMITDPRTTPSQRTGRVLFAILVSVVAAFITFGLYRADGLILALALCAPAVPLLERYCQPQPQTRPIPTSTTVSQESSNAIPHV